jgi:hypothetical protein
MSGSVFLAPTNDRHDAERLIRFAVLSRIEIFAYLIRTLLRFSAQTRTRAFSLPTASATASREKSGSVQSAPTVSGGLPSSDRLHTSLRRIRVVSRGCGDRGKVHPRHGQEAVSQVPLLAAASHRPAWSRLPRSAGLIPGSLPLVLGDRSGARLDIGQG